MHIMSVLTPDSQVAQHMGWFKSVHGRSED